MGNRDLAEIRAYHDGTKHSLASVSRTSHQLDWETMPQPFKVYPDLEPIPLPHDFTTSTRPALAVLADPGAAAGDGPPLDRAALARLLYFTAGVLRRRAYPGGEIYFRAAACTGALYHIDLYVVCGALADLEAGVYHFAPHDFALRRLRTGDHRRVLVEATADEASVAGAPVTLVSTSTFWRNAWKYRARTYRHCFWDDGTLLANLLALAAGVDLPARLVTGFADDAVNRLLDLDPEREVALSLVSLGRGAPPPPPAPPVAPLGLAVLPVSSREVRYPAIGEAHAASSLASPSEVAAWRDPLPSRPPPAPPGAVIPLPPLAPDAVREPIETVILRRGSTRRFTREPIDLATVAALLACATRGVPADALRPGAPLADLFLIVNAVTGLEPGAYVYDRARHALGLLAAGDFRREAGHLGLGQALPAEAAVDVFWLTDLEPVLARLGNRGYRVAGLEAAVEAGRTYLAAYALGLGATGLTFFDDDVIRFFAPHATGRSVMFLMAFGRPRGVRAAPSG
jgi:SagB-type dehydrogenase family enzyme